MSVQGKMVTPQEIEYLQELMKEHGTRIPFSHMARLWGRNVVTTAIYVERLRKGEPVHQTIDKQVRAKGLVGEIFKALDAKGLTNEEQARVVGCSRGAITRWRSGHNSPTFFITECLAQAAGLRIRLEVQEEKE